jgi:hypothetical protein
MSTRYKIEQPAAAGSAEQAAWGSQQRALASIGRDVETLERGPYTPGLAASWDGSPPRTIAEALDRCAALLKTLNAGTGP